MLYVLSCTHDMFYTNYISNTVHRSLNGTVKTHIEASSVREIKQDTKKENEIKEK